MRNAAEIGDKAELKRHLNDGAGIDSADVNVRCPSAAGLWRPSTNAEPPSAPLAAAAARRPSRRSPRALGRRPAAGSSLAALPLQCG